MNTKRTRFSIGVATLALLLTEPDGARARKPAPAPAGVGPTRNRDLGSLARPRPNSAWAALGFNRRGLRRGDRFVVAWASRARASTKKHNLKLRPPRSRSWFFAPYFVDYTVVEVRQERLGKQARTLAKIRIRYQRPQATSWTTAADVVVDQYYNPVSWRYYAVHLPHGRRADFDTRTILRHVGPFPFLVGDLENLVAKRADPPRLDPKLARLRMVRGAQLLHVPVASGKRLYADSYWSPGMPYASAVVGRSIQGVLVSVAQAR